MILSDVEQHWLFLRRYDLTDPQVVTLKSMPLYNTGTGVSATESYGYAAQNFRLTDYTYNGKSVWQGIADPTIWLVYANIPVIVTTGTVEFAEDIAITHTYVTPDPLGTVIKQGWKMTQAATLEAIVDGITAGDLFRGSFFPVRKHPNIVYGFIDGGAVPTPGVFFESFETNPGEDTILATPRFSVRAVKSCSTVGYPGADPILVNSIIDILDVLAKADATCAELGKTTSTFVTEILVDQDGTPPLSAKFFVEGYACCE